MDKVLGQEYGNIAERTAFLRDNCDAVEELGYVKPLANEQIEELKDKLVENNIQLRDVRADKRAQNKLYNEQIKQLEEENDGVTKQLKEKSEFVTENCFKFVDGDGWATTTRRAYWFTSVLHGLRRSPRRFSKFREQEQMVEQIKTKSSWKKK